MTTTDEQRREAKRLSLAAGVSLGERGLTLVAKLIGEAADARTERDTALARVSALEERVAGLEAELRKARGK